MTSIKEKTFKDEKEPHIIENTSSILSDNISSSSIPTTTLIFNTIITSDSSEPEITGEEDKNIEEIDPEKLIENINLKMLFNNDNNNDHLYDPISSKSIYDPHKFVEHEIQNTSVLSPESSLCDLEVFESINLNDNYHKILSQNDQITFYTCHGMDTPISHGSPAMPEELDDNITSKDCIPPNNLHILSQSSDCIDSIITSCSTTTANNNNNNNDNNNNSSNNNNNDNNNNNLNDNNNNNLNDDDDNLDINFDMEKLQPIKISEHNVGVKRKMETNTTTNTPTNTPTKKKRCNLKLNTTLKEEINYDEIMTSQIVENVLELEEKQMFTKFNTIDNNKMCLQSPALNESTNMHNNDIDFHETILNRQSPFVDVGTENSQHSFFGQIYNNNNNNNSSNIHQNSFNVDDDDDDESITNESSVATSPHNTSLLTDDIIIKEENPPSVVSSSHLWSSSDDYNCSTPSSFQPKRKRGRPRIVHRLEPTPKELQNLSDNDKKQKLLRVRNNKASQVSRDKKRNKVQNAEIQKQIEEEKNIRLKAELEKLEKMESIYKNALQKCVLNKDNR